MKCIYGHERGGEDEYFTIELILLRLLCFKCIGKLSNILLESGNSFVFSVCVGVIENRIGIH